MTDRRCGTCEHAKDWSPEFPGVERMGSCRYPAPNPWKHPASPRFYVNPNQGQNCPTWSAMDPVTGPAIPPLPLTA